MFMSYAEDEIAAAAKSAGDDTVILGGFRGLGREAQSELQELVPYVARRESFYETVDARRMQQCSLDLSLVIPADIALYQCLACAPHPGITQRVLNRLTGCNRSNHARERPYFFGHHPQHQGSSGAFTLQAFENAHEMCGVAGQQYLSKAEDVEARDVEHRFLDLRRRQFPGRKQEREFLHFLVRSQQIALDLIRDERKGLVVRRLVLCFEARGEPSGQRCSCNL